MTTEIITYRKVLPGGLLVQHMQPYHAQQLEALQRIVFPDLAEDELIKAPHYLRHLDVFPEGQFVITDSDKVVGMTTTMRSNFDFTDYYHTFKETIAGGWLTRHEPGGDWLYGLDVGVHPKYRGMGLARELYRARHYVARQLGLKGQVTVGMMNGYGAVSNEMSGEQYYQELLAGKRKDPTVSAQMKVGFEPIALIPDYLNDPTCGNYGVLIKLDIDKEP
ncbi:GNAT family N-acetyltransferase [Foetidibacter luteolus]|uniref:GNAT family N-acetyltransferase n=1 Tax=Foetidibacter luteolus TaxID=2608880 RepID=UPI00129BABCE|nr:GNAT family N-acetyltransferase [Foetidibacter luteolus]